MKDYKRLTNTNLDEFNPEYDFCIGCEYFGEPKGCNMQSGSCGNYEQFNELYNRLYELEDKIEQGLILELPCKVGDTVYKIDSDIDYERGKDSHRCTIKYYPRAVKIKNHADLFYFMYMREIDEMFETEEQAFEKLKIEKTELEEMYADKDFIDEVLVELRGGK